MDADPDTSLRTMPQGSPPAYEALVQFLYGAPVGLVQTSLSGDISMINPKAAQLLMPLVADGNLFNLFDVLETVAPQLRALAMQPTESGSLICDALHLPLPGSGLSATVGAAQRTLALQLLRLDDATLMGTLTDATAAIQHEQQRLAARLHAATRTDVLTTLPNRLALLEAIDAAMENGAPPPGVRWAVLLVNADRFESVNITHGPIAGDAVLRAMAGRLHAFAGGPTAAHDGHGCTVARFGSDEFAVLLRVQGHGDAVDTPGSDAATAACDTVARSLVESLGAPYRIGETGVHASVSVGVVGVDASHRHAVAVMQDADLAMREAKRLGGSRHSMFTPALRTQAWKRGSLEADLRRALEESQLFVVYQPIVSLADGAVTGMEALVRWQHPQRGVVPPDQFIGIAEETGLILVLGEWVLLHACEQLAEWQRTLGPRAPRSMSVNLSRAQILEPSIVGTVARALAASGLAAGALQLEVTESLAAQDTVVQQRLEELKALGLTLALDDFGTGYSSLASLHLLPIDVVKIDRSFVAQSVTNPHHRVLIEAVIMVARSLGLQVVAEGVETLAQAELLAALDCDKAQGYFYARPSPDTAATAWLLSR